MSTTIYTVDLFEKFRFSANLTEASAPICTVDDEGEEHATQYQTTDARHRVYDAARLALSSCGREYYAEPGDDRDEDEILDELLDGAEIEAEDDESE